MDDAAEDFRLQEFCSNYAFGMTIPEALRHAGYDPKALTLDFGLKLLKKPEAQAYVNSHRESLKEKLGLKLNDLANQLERDREFAYASNNPNAAVTATMNKAKLLGLLDPSAEAKGKKLVITWLDDDKPAAEGG